MYSILDDRIFWIYLIVALFFIIIGIGSILSSNNDYLIIISIFWLLSNISLLIVVYNASIKWGPDEQADCTKQVCFVDNDSGCFNPKNRTWLFINILFIFLLIISILWAGELGNEDSGPLKTMSGIIMILGGLLLMGLINDKKFIYGTYNSSFWVSFFYLLIWVGLTIYATLN